jgi:hypothetical protein
MTYAVAIILKPIVLMPLLFVARGITRLADTALPPCTLKRLLLLRW